MSLNLTPDSLPNANNCGKKRFRDQLTNYRVIEPRTGPQNGVDPLAYYTALAALEPVANRLERGSGQYWIDGKLCRTLDQVVNSLIEIPTQYPGQ